MDAIELGCVCWRGPVGAPVVVAVHGITANAWSFASVAEHLNGEVALVAVDLRGSVRNQRSFIVGGGNFDIDFAIRGPDLAALLDYTDRLKARAIELGGMVDLDTTLRLSRPELRVAIDHPDSELNAVDALLHGEFTRLFRELKREDDARAVLLIGRGRAFSAGDNFLATARAIAAAVNA